MCNQSFLYVTPQYSLQTTHYIHRRTTFKTMQTDRQKSFILRLLLWQIIAPLWHIKHRLASTKTGLEPSKMEYHTDSNGCTSEPKNIMSLTLSLEFKVDSWMKTIAWCIWSNSGVSMKTLVSWPLEFVSVPYRDVVYTLKLRVNGEKSNFVKNQKVTVLLPWLILRRRRKKVYLFL